MKGKLYNRLYLLDGVGPWNIHEAVDEVLDEAKADVPKLPDYPLIQDRIDHSILCSKWFKEWFGEETTK